MNVTSVSKNSRMTLPAVRCDDWPAIAKLLDEWQPQKLIVGLPLDMRGNEQEMSQRAARFGRQLEGRFRIPVEFSDERLTTREAWTLSIDSGKHHSKPDIDSLSAVLITESWLRDYDED